MIYPACVVIAHSTVLFIFCYCGNRVTDSFEQISVAAYNSIWYMYPMEMRKKLPTIIQMAEKPIYITGLSLIVCSLETFKVVITMFVGIKKRFSNNMLYFYFLAYKNILFVFDGPAPIWGLNQIIFVIKSKKSEVSCYLFIQHNIVFIDRGLEMTSPHSTK